MGRVDEVDSCGAGQNQGGAGYDERDTSGEGLQVFLAVLRAAADVEEISEFERINNAHEWDALAKLVRARLDKNQEVLLREYAW